MSGATPFIKAQKIFFCLYCYPGATDSLNPARVYLKSYQSMQVKSSTRQLSVLRTQAALLIRSYLNSPIISEKLNFQVAFTSQSSSTAIFTEFPNKIINSLRSSEVGQSRKRWASSLPGRSTAGSMRSGRELAATMQTPEMEDTPSRQHKNWFTMRSFTPVLLALLFGTIDSNSSKNIMLGLTLNAFSNTSRTAASEPPIYLLKMSEPFTLKYLILNSSFNAEPRAVLPFPVPPQSRMPLGSFIGTDLKRKAYFIGFYMMFLTVFLAAVRPASLLKSKHWDTVFVCGCDSSTACLQNDPKLSDYVLQATATIVDQWTGKVPEISGFILRIGESSGLATM